MAKIKVKKNVAPSKMGKRRRKKSRCIFEMIGIEKD
jgi:hypothetical protein